MSAMTLSDRTSGTTARRGRDEYTSPSPARLQRFASLRMQRHVFFGNRTLLLNLAAGLLAMTGLAAAVAFSVANSFRSGQPLDDPAFVQDIAVFGFPFAQIFLGVVAILFICSEWSSGFIYTTHSAIQRPLSFVVAKTMWPALACAVGTVAMMVVVVPLENWLLAGTPYSILLFDAAVWRQIAALAFVTVSAVSFAAGIALILRNSATALGLYISIILIAPIIIGQIPVDAAREIAKWLPNNVFNFLTTNAPDAMATLNYPLLIAAAIAYPLAVLAIGFLRLRRRVV